MQCTTEPDVHSNRLKEQIEKMLDQIFQHRGYFA